jgi:PAS domain S-box-containing protein
LGAIAFISAESGRRYGAADLAVAEDLARRAAVAADNALLYRAATEAGALVESVFAGAPVGLAFWDTELRYVRVNDAMCAINGLAASDVVGRRVFEVFPGFEEQLDAVLRKALAGEAMLDVPVAGETPAAPGQLRSWRASFYPVRNDAGTVVGVGGTIQETTAQQRAQAEVEAARRRLEFLSEVSETLAATLEFPETLQRVAELVVPRISDFFGLYVADDDGRTLVRVAHAHVDPALEAAVAGFDATYDVVRDAEVPFVRAFLTGEPLHLSDVDAVPAVAARNEDERTVAARLASRSVIVLPLIVHDRRFGAITFSSRQQGRHGPEDLELARELARRVAVAIDRARLYRDAQESVAQLRAVLDQLPIGVLIADAAGKIILGNAAIERIWRLPLVKGAEIEGRPRFRAWHADGREVELDTWPIARSLGRDEVVIDERITILRGDGTRGTIESSSLPVRDESGRLVAAVALTVDVTERLRQDERVRFLASAGDLLNASLDADETLASIASLAVPGLAGQCIVDLVEEDGSLRCVATAHLDPDRADLLREMRQSYPPIRPGHPVQRALATGEPQFLPELDHGAIEAMAHDARHAELIRTLANTSGIVAPLIARGRTLGAITLGTVSPQAPFEAADVELAQELARRAATAVENALLYRAAESRAQAAQALAFVDDGVFLADETEIVRLWNPAAAAIIGVDAEDAVGRPVGDSIRDWDGLQHEIPVAPHPQPGGSRATTVPVDLAAGERWIAISGVRFPGGTVYAFRDVTEEQKVERLKSDFVSTVSHELRTPLAAIYGAALTLRRGDVRLEETQRAGLLEVIATEADRLARIVNDILWASRLDSGSMTIEIESCDGGALARQVFDATAQYAPEGISLALHVPADLPPVAADPAKISQVLTNLLENAVKYSPDGGTVELAAEPSDGRLRFRVRDEGLGIPPAEHERIFEKFYRLDPNLTRGVGGTGLGLYICRELVHRMHGFIWVESDGRRGSTFLVELPLAEN